MVMFQHDFGYECVCMFVFLIFTTIINSWFSMNLWVPYSNDEAIYFFS